MSCRLLLHKPNELCIKLFLRFGVGKVERNAIDRAHFHTLRYIEMSDAFGAFVRIDFVYFQPLIYRLIRTFRFAYIAVNALIGDL